MKLTFDDIISKSLLYNLVRDLSRFLPDSVSYKFIKKTSCDAVETFKRVVLCSVFYHMLKDSPNAAKRIMGYTLLLSGALIIAMHLFLDTASYGTIRRKTMFVSLSLVMIVYLLAEGKALARALSILEKSLVFRILNFLWLKTRKEI